MSGLLRGLQFYAFIYRKREVRNLGGYGCLTEWLVVLCSVVSIVSKMKALLNKDLIQWVNWLF